MIKIMHALWWRTVCAYPSGVILVLIARNSGNKNQYNLAWAHKQFATREYKLSYIYIYVYWSTRAKNLYKFVEKVCSFKLRYFSTRCLYRSTLYIKPLQHIGKSFVIIDILFVYIIKAISEVFNEMIFTAWNHIVSTFNGLIYKQFTFVTIWLSARCLQRDIVAISCYYNWDSHSRATEHIRATNIEVSDKYIRVWAIWPTFCRR